MLNNVYAAGPDQNVNYFNGLIVQFLDIIASPAKFERGIFVELEAGAVGASQNFTVSLALLVFAKSIMYTEYYRMPPIAQESPYNINMLNKLDRVFDIMTRMLTRCLEVTEWVEDLDEDNNNYAYQNQRVLPQKIQLLQADLSRLRSDLERVFTLPQWQKMVRMIRSSIRAALMQHPILKSCNTAQCTAAIKIQRAFRGKRGRNVAEMLALNKMYRPGGAGAREAINRLKRAKF